MGTDKRWAKVATGWSKQDGPVELVVYPTPTPENPKRAGWTLKGSVVLPAGLFVTPKTPLLVISASDVDNKDEDVARFCAERFLATLKRTYEWNDSLLKGMKDRGVDAMHFQCVYMVLCNSAGVVHVKEGAFFADQGGFDSGWGANWQMVLADGIESARYIGTCVLNGAKEYHRQAGYVPDVAARMGAIGGFDLKYGPRCRREP